MAAGIEDRHALARRALGYVELYGAYTETDPRYRVDNLMEPAESVRRRGPRPLRVDPGSIDWDQNVHEIHLPSVWSTPGCARSPGSRWWTSAPTANARRSCRRTALAVFALEYTLMSSNVVDTYAWLASRHLSPSRRARVRRRPSARGRRCTPSTGATAATSCAPSYRRFEDAQWSNCETDSWELFHRQLLTRSFPDGFARVRAHRALGHRTLLITGALDFIIEPIRPLFDDIVCAEMESRDGRLTGHLTTLPPIGEAGALLLADYAEAHSLSLEESVAYADSASDLAMLEAVGFPVAVNPESRLSAIARRRGWHVEHWAKAQGGSHRPLPLGPFDVKSPKAVMGR